MISIGLFWWKTPPLIALAILMLPLIIDGTLQHKTRYESNNRRRFITGLACGYAALTLILISFVWAYRIGLRIGPRIWN